MANEFNIKNGFISNGNSIVKNNLNVSGNTIVGGSIGIGTDTPINWLTIESDSETNDTGAYINLINTGVLNFGTEKIGLKISASGASSVYSLQLQDGTEGVGKFLYSVTSDGKTRWTDNLSGSTLLVTGNSNLQSLSATTISATTVNTHIPLFNPNEIFRGQTHRNNSTTIDTYGGYVSSTSASVQAQSVGTTDFRDRSIRLRYYASVVTTGRYSGVRGSSQQFWSITGGFRFVCDFTISDAANSTNTQTFMGLAAQNTDLAYGGNPIVNVSTLTNLIGVGNDQTDTNLYIIHNDASGTATKIDLGANFPCQRTGGVNITTIYSVQIYNAPTSTEVRYEVINKENGAVARGIITSDLPSTSSLLNLFASRAMGAPVTNTGEFYLYNFGVYHLL